MFAWYLPSSDRWIRCEIIGEFVGRYKARLYTGEIINNLHRRKCGGSWILEK